MEWLTFRCWLPDSSKQTYALQQSETMVVPAAVFSYISGNMVSFDLSSTGTMKKSSVWCRRCYRTPIEPIYVSDYGPDHFHRPIYMDFPEELRPIGHGLGRPPNSSSKNEYVEFSSSTQWTCIPSSRARKHFQKMSFWRSFHKTLLF